MDVPFLLGGILFLCLKYRKHTENCNRFVTLFSVFKMYNKDVAGRTARKEKRTMRKVKINAAGVNSRFGIVLDSFGGMNLVKVACAADWMDCLEEKHCVILGDSYLSPVK